MSRALSLLSLLLLCAAYALGRFPDVPTAPVDAAVLEKLNFAPIREEAVFLSQHLHEPEVARELSRVTLPIEVNGAPILSSQYAGYITVNETWQSNLFYWFFEPQNFDPDAPIILWLQGGPGASSLFGLFGENGPFVLTQDLQLVTREINWNAAYGLLYIDQPVGTGFSYTESQDGVCTNEEEVARDLFSALTQFFTAFPQYQKNDFYISGESYAGKYVPSIAWKIYTEEKANPANVIFNFVGFSIGDGLVSPIHQLQGYMYMAEAFGVADNNQVEQIERYGEKFAELLDQYKYGDAATILVDDAFNYYLNISGSNNPYDVRLTEIPFYCGNITAFVSQADVRAALHVGNQPYSSTGAVAAAGLWADQAKSVLQYLPDLLDHYKVLIYNGQFDYIVGPLTTETMLYEMEWIHTTAFLETSKTIWVVDNATAGYARQYNDFYQVVVRDAGHMAPGDQPANVLDMINRFVSGVGFGPDE